MTEHPADRTLTFKGYAIRFAMLDGVPWFSLTDICEVMSYYGDNAAALSANLPDHACRDCFAETDAGETVEATLISPVGVWWLTTLTNPARFQQLAAWSRKEAKRLCPDPQPNDPAMFLALDSDLEMPPYAYRYSGRRAEWEALKDAAFEAQWEADRVATHASYARWRASRALGPLPGQAVPFVAPQAPLPA